MPLTRIPSVVAGAEIPHDIVIVYVAATPAAPPNGTTLETALPAKLSTSALRVGQAGHGVRQHEAVGEHHEDPERRELDQLDDRQLLHVIEDLGVARTNDRGDGEGEEDHDDGQRDDDLDDSPAW